MGNLIGYARVSTKHQSLELQVEELEKFGCDKIFKEVITGSRKHRPELDKMLAYIREGDKVVVSKLDRIGRSMTHLIELFQFFEQNKIEFISINGNLDTSTAQGRLMFNIMSSFAEFEREMIRERTRAGLDGARLRGRIGGRPQKDKKKVERAVKMYRSKEFKVNDICEMCEMTPATLYRYIKKYEGVEL